MSQVISTYPKAGGIRETRFKFRQGEPRRRQIPREAIPKGGRAQGSLLGRQACRQRPERPQTQSQEMRA